MVVALIATRSSLVDVGSSCCRMAVHSTTAEVSTCGRHWADALGVPGQWPFFDLAVMFDPSVENNPVWMERLEADSGHKLWTRSRQVVADMFRWASLGDRPKERFPEFDDPYEPMIQLLERGGEIWPATARSSST
ncbi:hypothetical protein [Kribbella kalugense]|uniref:Uncharacterized protein n=1 Tax=Kribbella kalugense TaxID=2512221 RepID=A0A4R7ZQ95_9ACTN|nr:hypothetical protein [Kribbella kalugense]TDW18951.1 hypothetical protein EV650_5554 [Kribbella kalugense]